MNVNVGIISAHSVKIRFSGRFTLVDGSIIADTTESFSVSPCGALSWRGETFTSLSFHPSGDAFFEVLDVTIGIGFHWQRNENQSFEGVAILVADGGKIQLIDQVDVEHYLLSVISSEMKATSPLQLLKAHAIISRSWLMAQIRNKSAILSAGMIDNPDNGIVVKWFDRENHKLFDVCADDHCQRYQGISRISNPLVVKAVEETAGMVLVDDCGELCDTRFSKCCGGVSELFESCWADRHFSYLVPVRDNAEESPIPNLSDEDVAEDWILNRPDAFCANPSDEVLDIVLNSYDRDTTPDFYRWQVEYSAPYLTELLHRRSGIDFGRIKAIESCSRGASGRITLLRIVGEKRSVEVGKELMIRRWLSESHLYSSAFIVEYGERDTDGFPISFVLKGAGWGHGVGLCQIGAAVMAVEGYSFEKILSHYFPGSHIISLDKC